MLSMIATVPSLYCRPLLPLCRACCSLSEGKSSCHHGRNSQVFKYIGCIQSCFRFTPACCIPVVPFKLLLPVFQSLIYCRQSTLILLQLSNSDSRLRLLLFLMLKHFSLLIYVTSPVLLSAVPFLNMLPTSSAVTVPGSDICICSYINHQHRALQLL